MDDEILEYLIVTDEIEEFVEEKESDKDGEEESS